MLKKNNKILVGCLALLLVMAVGYALFSETITINGTATAKGEFDMEVTCTPGLTDGFTNQEAGFSATDNNYENDSCTVSGNEVTYNVDLLQPGAMRYFTVKITNKGTMTAILGEDGLEENIYGCKGNYSTGEFEDCKEDPNVSNGLQTFNFVGFADENKIYHGDDPGAEKFENENGVVLEPNESVYLVFSSKWDEAGIGGEANDVASGTLYKEKTKVKFTFSQPK